MSNLTSIFYLTHLIPDLTNIYYLENYLSLTNISCLGNCLTLTNIELWAHVILEVILGMTNPKVIDSKSGRINGRETFTHSEKRRINTLSRVMPLVPVRSNWSGYFCSARQRIRCRRLQGCKIFFSKPFCLVFSLEK